MTYRASLQNHLQNELDRADRNGVTAATSKNPRQAIQFSRKTDAVAMARELGWPVSSPLQQDVMGFQIWVLSDDHLNFLTARGALSRLGARASA